MRNYNERSWGIDIISEINSWASKKSVQIKRAGGEETLTSESGSLFPDVLLFGDQSKSLILQGWELKFPDTPINDTELIQNATQKARRLGLNSFLIWNVSIAQLFVKRGNEFSVYKVWSKLAHICERNQVLESIDETYSLLHEILQDLNQFFNNGIIQPTTIIDSLSSDEIIDVLFQNSGIYSEALKDYSKINSQFEDEVIMWWISAEWGYPEGSDKWKVLAKTNLLSIFNKFVFAHVLKRNSNEANKVDIIREPLNVREGLDVFQEISKVTDYWNILSTSLGEELLPKKAWKDFLDLNQLLRNIDVSLVDNSVISTLLNKLLIRSRRKSAGLFVTPEPLAGLVSRLVLEDPNQIVIDPCCGTGTILKAIFEIKKEKDVKNPSETIWGSDKYIFPLRLATFSMSIPENLGRVLKIFQKDIIDIIPGNNIELHDPYNGEALELTIPRFRYIISNLPFVRQESITKLNPTIQDINSWIAETLSEDVSLENRSDLVAYLPFYIWRLLDDEGRVGFILSNSWLGTDWGNTFFNLLRRFYIIETIVTSGSGRWFKEAKVVTNIVILRKNKELSVDKSDNTKFVILKKNIEALADIETQRIVKSSINTISSSSNDWVNVRSYSHKELERIETLQIPLTSLFSDLTWIYPINSKLLPLKETFKIARGERRGWDALFLPSNENRIEDVYLQPILKSSQSIENLKAKADGWAFCCDKSQKELLELNHIGALDWIKLFEIQTNTIGKPLPEVLSNRSGGYWYTMKPNTLADLVISMNPGDRLFFARFGKPTFVNQRLIRLTKLKEDIDLDLVHALLNSIVGLFFIEAIGFGRGEGVLDLNSTKINNSMRILNPTIIASSHRESIVTSFDRLLTRNILPIEQELEMQDRKDFDNEVLKAFGLLDIYNQVKDSLLTLYRIRTTVND